MSGILITTQKLKRSHCNGITSIIYRWFSLNFTLRYAAHNLCPFFSLYLCFRFFQVPKSNGFRFYFQFFHSFAERPPNFISFLFISSNGFCFYVSLFYVFINRIIKKSVIKVYFDSYFIYDLMFSSIWLTFWKRLIVSGLSSIQNAWTF